MEGADETAEIHVWAELIIYLVNVAGHEGREEDLGQGCGHRVDRRDDVRVHKVLSETLTNWYIQSWQYDR